MLQPDEWWVKKPIHPGNETLPGSVDSPFPLPLQPFEELFVRDDSPPLYPAVFSARFKFSTAIDFERAKEAFRVTVLKHPMLRCLLHEKRNGSLEWIDCPTAQLPEPIWVEPGDNRDSRLRPFDLRNEPPCRLELTGEADQSTATFQFHHAACDGVGALQAINDWMRAYQALTVGKSTGKAAHALNVAQLQDRCQAKLTLRERWKLARWSWLSLLGMFAFLTRRPVPIVNVAQLNQLEPSGSSIQSAALTAEQTKKMQQRAAGFGVSVNDLVVVELACAIKTWQLKKSIEPTGSHYRINVPINERSVRHRRMPAANHCTMIAVDLNADAVPTDGNESAFASILQYVHRDIKTVRDFRLSLFFWSSLRIFRRLGILERMACGPKVHATCVLTNLGKLPQRLRLPKSDSTARESDGAIGFGNGWLESACIPPPIRYGTAATMCIYFYRRQFCITMNFDSSSISPTDADDLLAQLVMRLS